MNDKAWRIKTPSAYLQLKDHKFYVIGGKHPEWKFRTMEGAILCARSEELELANIAYNAELKDWVRASTLGTRNLRVVPGPSSAYAELVVDADSEYLIEPAPTLTQLRTDVSASIRRLRNADDGDVASLREQAASQMETLLAVISALAPGLDITHNGEPL